MAFVTNILLMKILNFSEAEQQLCMKTIYALVPSQIQ